MKGSTCVGLVNGMALRLYLYTACGRCCNLSFYSSHSGWSSTYISKQRWNTELRPIHRKQIPMSLSPGTPFLSLKAAGLGPRLQPGAGCACVPSLSDSGPTLWQVLALLPRGRQVETLRAQVEAVASGSCFSSGLPCGQENSPPS